MQKLKPSQETDIVDRLLNMYNSNDFGVQVESILHEAADTIRRLRGYQTDLLNKLRDAQRREEDK